MNQQPDNPFASPAMGQSQKRHRRSYRGLILLWIWLGLASFQPILVKLSDPISNVILLLANLIPLWIGWGLVATTRPRLWGSRGPAATKRRWFHAIFWLFTIVATVCYFRFFPFFSATGGTFYMFINVALAAFAASRLGERRLKVMTYLSIGFVLGTPLICYGTLIGGVVASLLAVRNTTPRAEIADESQDDAQADSPH